MAEKSREELVLAPDPSAWKSIKVLICTILGNSHYVASIAALIVAISAHYKVNVDPVKVEQVLQILKQLNDQPLPPQAKGNLVAPSVKAKHITFVVDPNPPENVCGVHWGERWFRYCSEHA